MQAEKNTSTQSALTFLSTKILELKTSIQDQCASLKIQMGHRNLSLSLQPAIKELELKLRELREATTQMKSLVLAAEEEHHLPISTTDLAALIATSQAIVINAYRNEISRLLLVIKQIRALNETAKEALILAKLTVSLCEHLQQAIEIYAEEQPHETVVIQQVQQSAHHLKVLVHLGIGLQYDLHQEPQLANQHFEIAWYTTQFGIPLADTDRALLLFSLLNHNKAELVEQVKVAIQQYCDVGQLPIQFLMYQKQGTTFLEKQQFARARQAYEKAQHLAEISTHLANIGYSQLAISHTYTMEFKQHIKIHSQAKLLRTKQDQLLQQALILLLQGLESLTIQSSKTLISSADIGWIKQTYSDLELIAQQYAEWANEASDSTEKKAWLEKAIDARETLVDFFGLLKSMKRNYLESTTGVVYQSTKNKSSIANLEKGNVLALTQLKSSLANIEELAQQTQEQVLQEAVKRANRDQEYETLYEQFKHQLEEQEKIREKVLAEKAEQQRQKTYQQFILSANVPVTPVPVEQTKSVKAPEKNSVSPPVKQPRSKSEQLYLTACRLFQKDDNPKEAEKVYRMVLAQATEQEALIKAKAYCGVADCCNQQARDLLKSRQLPQALVLFREAIQQAVSALKDINQLIALKRRGKKIAEPASELQAICDAIEMVIESTQRVLKKTENYWAKRYLLLKSARDQAFARITSQKGLAYWYRNKKMEERSPASIELSTCSQYYQEIVLTEEALVSAEAVAKHLKDVAHSMQWTQYDLKTAESLRQCQQQLMEVQDAFRESSVPAMPTINQKLTEALTSGSPKAQQVESKKAAHPLLLKGIITIPVFTMTTIISLPTPVATLLTQLQQASYQAYVVGGGTRDLLLGKSPKDFDIITTAPLKALQDLCKQGGVSQHIPNLYKLTCEQMRIDMMMYPELDLVTDAAKRDFTINALYADAKGTVFDPLGKALSDMKTHTLAFIATPASSIDEDPLRLMRLARLMVETQWELPSSLQTIAVKSASLITTCEPGRLRFECRKQFLQGKAVAHYHALHQLNLFQILFPSTAAYLAQERVGECYQQWLLQQLQSTDERVQSGKPVSLDYIFAMFEVGHLFWYRPTLRTDTGYLKQANTLLADAWYRQTNNSKEEDITPYNEWVQQLANDYVNYQLRVAKNTLTNLK